MFHHFSLINNLILIILTLNIKFGGLVCISGSLALSLIDNLIGRLKILMTRKDRSDIKIESLGKKHGIPTGAFRKDSGRKTRKDKRLGAVRKELAK